MLFLLLVQFLIFNSCIIQENPENPEVINAYIDEYVNNQKYDERLYEPPPPPEWQDSLQHNGRIKPDSIIENLKPLKIFINYEVKYDSIFLFDGKLKKGFRDIENIGELRKDIRLNGMSFDKKKGINLEFLSSEAFFKKHRIIQFDEDYGGFLSLKNLYYSKDSKKAIFKIDFYRGRLNSSSSIIYAEKQSDGTWKFESELLSIS